MSKEIEKKWLWNPNEPLEYYIGEAPCVDIKDYYFNDYCRMRMVNGLCYLTIKSKGNLIREEYEFLVDKEQDLDFIPAPVIRKTRYFYQENKFIYEINIFRDICIGYGQPLVIVELELEAPSLLPNHLPRFCGQDVTNENSIYGYEIFKMLKEGYDKSMPIKRKEDNIIYIADYRKGE